MTTKRNPRHIRTGGTIVDVRTQEEFQSGHLAGSVNIPLQELAFRIEELRELPKPLTVCCASGMRSALAIQLLAAQGIRAQDGGSWLDLRAAQ